jgi:hypothetical protein
LLCFNDKTGRIETGFPPPATQDQNLGTRGRLPAKRNGTALTTKQPPPIVAFPRRKQAPKPRRASPHGRDPEARARIPAAGLDDPEPGAGERDHVNRTETWNRSSPGSPRRTCSCFTRSSMLGLYSTTMPCPTLVVSVGRMAPFATNWSACAASCVLLKLKWSKYAERPIGEHPWS